MQYEKSLDNFMSLKYRYQFFRSCIYLYAIFKPEYFSDSLII